MADPVSALDGHIVSGRFGNAAHPAVAIEEVGEFCLIQLAAWPETVSALGIKTAEAFDIPGAPGPGKFVETKDGLLLRVEPLKWWLVALGEASVSPPAVSPDEGSLLDMSQSRAWLKFRGDKAQTLLNHFLPVDLREASFPPGSVASTAFHHTGVTVWRTDGEYNLLLPRSFAVSLWEMLRDSAKQYGLEVH